MTQAEAAIDQMNEGWCAEMCALVVPPTDVLTCNQMVYCLLFNTTEAASWADIKTNMLSSGFKAASRTAFAIPQLAKNRLTMESYLSRHGFKDC